MDLPKRDRVIIFGSGIYPKVEKVEKKCVVAQGRSMLLKAPCSACLWLYLCIPGGFAEKPLVMETNLSAEDFCEVLLKFAVSKVGLL